MTVKCFGAKRAELWCCEHVWCCCSSARRHYHCAQRRTVRGGIPRRCQSQICNHHGSPTLETPHVISPRVFKFCTNTRFLPPPLLHDRTDECKHTFYVWEDELLSGYIVHQELGQISWDYEHQHCTSTPHQRVHNTTFPISARYKMLPFFPISFTTTSHPAKKGLTPNCMYTHLHAPTHTGVVCVLLHTHIVHSVQSCITTYTEYTRT